jgi:hypothetical protein
MEPTLLLRGQMVVDPSSYLRAYRECWYWSIAAEYLDTDTGSPDEFSAADVATSLLMNSQATAYTVRTIVSHGPAWSQLLKEVPADLQLQDETAPSYFEAVARLIEAMTSKGVRTPFKPDGLRTDIGVSRATKVAHQKRSGLIPVLDNEAIFALFCNPPVHDPGWGSRCRGHVVAALTQIRAALCRDENQPAWNALAEVEPNWSRIDHFDAVWWIHTEEARWRRRTKNAGGKPPRRETCINRAGLCPYACAGLTPPPAFTSAAKPH